MRYYNPIYKSTYIKYYWDFAHMDHKLCNLWCHKSSQVRPFKLTTNMISNQLG